MAESKVPAGSHPVEPVKSTGKKIKNKFYDQEMARLQIELVKLQEWIKPNSPLTKSALDEGAIV